MRRRTLLLAGTGLAGALVVGWGLLPPRSRVGSPSLLAAVDGVALNGWIAIGADGAVQLAMPRSEMGQGVHTALAMLVAEELDVPLAAIRLVAAGHDAIYGNVAMFVGGLPVHPRDAEPDPAWSVRAGEWMVAKVARELGINATGGSSSVADAWQPLRLAAATARAQLLGAASLAWGLPRDELSTADAVVSHPSGRRAGFGALAEAASRTPPGDVAPKAREAWALIGRSAPRLEAAAKSDGSAVFGIDVRLPGMVYAAVRHCPMIGGHPGRVDVAPALARPGVERIVRLGPVAGSTAALAVVGRSTWHAMEGAKALVVDWRQRPAGALDSAAIARELEAAARRDDGVAFHAHGDADAALAGAVRTVEALYRAPYLAHVTMEPINATARVADGCVEVWAPTQVPGAARAVAARAAGVPEDAVTVHVTYLGGGFGRRLDVDFVGQAVRVAMETGGRPVQLVWQRDEDIGHDFYRPAGAAWMRAGFGADGTLTTIVMSSAGDAITPRWLARALPALSSRIEMPDKTTSEGLFDLPYGVPNRRIAHTATHSGVPVGFWRAVGHSHNAFFAEGFVDELAHAAGADPVAFRLGLLDGLPRHAAVLQKAADEAGWGRPPPAGTARGVALHESFGSIVAQVVEVTRQGAGAAARPRVTRVVCAVDCGTAVNPDGIAQQMESGVLFGLAAALHARVDIEGGVVRQKNLPDLPPLTMAETPPIETHVLPSTRAPAGMGEPGLPPVAPALANAWFALTGDRRRELPFVSG